MPCKMERYFFYLLYLLLGCSLCGCSRKQAPKQTQDPDTETTIPYVDTIAAPVPPAPAKSRTARYLDSLGFVNIAEADSSIAIDLMYTRADNFTGTLLYEDLKEAYLHPDAMKSLKRAQRLLKEQYPGYSLIVYDAARPGSPNPCLHPRARERVCMPLHSSTEIVPLRTECLRAESRSVPQPFLII